jgi:hypothetical protein
MGGNLKLRNIKSEFLCVRILFPSRDIQVNLYVVCLNMISKGPYEMDVWGPIKKVLRLNLWKLRPCMYLQGWMVNPFQAGFFTMCALFLLRIIGSLDFVLLLHWMKLALSIEPNRVGVSHPFTWEWKQPVSEMSPLKYRTMDNVQKPSNPECYTPSTEPYRIYTISFWNCQQLL